MKRKLLAMLVCVALVSTLFPFAALAEETQARYVAIGDSISSGYGLQAPETEAFPSLIAQDDGYTLTIWLKPAKPLGACWQNWRTQRWLRL